MGSSFLFRDVTWSPLCFVVYCNYPGTIENGQILLVGAIGKYEYRHYVRRIGHNEKIEYICHKGYKRVGPMAATCVDGLWSPKMKPFCVLGQHPKMLYIFRGKRDVAGSLVEVGNNSIGEQQVSYIRNLSNTFGGKSVDTNGGIRNCSKMSPKIRGQHKPGPELEPSRNDTEWRAELVNKEFEKHRRKEHYKSHRKGRPTSQAGVQTRLEAQGKVKDRKRQHRRDGERAPRRWQHGWIHYETWFDGSMCYGFTSYPKIFIASSHMISKSTIRMRSDELIFAEEWSPNYSAVTGQQSIYLWVLNQSTQQTNVARPLTALQKDH